MKFFLLWIAVFILLIGEIFLYDPQSFQGALSNIANLANIQSGINSNKKTSLDPSLLAQNPEDKTDSISSGGRLNYNIGMAVGETLLYMSDSDMNKELDDMVSLGIGWVRFDIDWSHIQPNNSTDFYWINIDRLVVAAHTRKIRLLPIIDDAPPWARSANCADSTHCDPADHAAFATFAQAVVNRYKTSGIHTWEIWNEPNLHGFWVPVANTSAYLDLLEKTYTAIKAAQPNSIVLLGGMGPGATDGSNIAPIDFLTQIYAAGGGKYFDAVAFHPYSFPAMPNNKFSWSGWSQMIDTNPSLRSVMSDNGDASKKIWLTEFGAPTGGPGNVEASNSDKIFADHPDHVTEDIQSQMFSQAIAVIKKQSWDGPLFIYSYKDQGTSSNTIENFFGIVRYDESNKPAYSTVQNLIKNI